MKTAKQARLEKGFSLGKGITCGIPVPPMLQNLVFLCSHCCYCQLYFIPGSSLIRSLVCIHKRQSNVLRSNYCVYKNVLIFKVEPLGNPSRDFPCCIWIREQTCLWLFGQWLLVALWSVAPSVSLVSLWSVDLWSVEKVASFALSCWLDPPSLPFL